MWCATSEYDDNTKLTRRLRAHSLVRCRVSCALVLVLGFHVVFGVGRLVVRFHHIRHSKFFSCCSPTLSCHPKFKLHPQLLLVTHRENGPFEVLSSQNLCVSWTPVILPDCVWKDHYQIITRTMLQEKVTIHQNITILYTNL